MSSRRRKLLARVNWYLQFSLKHISQLITGKPSYYRGGRYRQVSLYVIHFLCWQRIVSRDKLTLNTWRSRQNGRRFPDNIFKCILLKGNAWISLKISMKFVPQGPINNIPSLVQIMAWRRPGDKPLFGPMMVKLSTHICVTRPQWVNDRSDHAYCV